MDKPCLKMIKNTKFNTNLTVQAVSIRAEKVNVTMKRTKKKLAANDFSSNAGESDDSSVGHKAPRRVTHLQLPLCCTVHPCVIDSVSR